MIIQLNYVFNKFERQYGKTLYLHHEGKLTDDAVLDCIADHYGYLPETMALSKDSYGDTLVTCMGAPLATLWPVFCSYDKEGQIIDSEFRPLNVLQYMEMYTKKGLNNDVESIAAQPG